MLLAPCELELLLALCTFHEPLAHKAMGERHQSKFALCKNLRRRRVLRQSFLNRQLPAGPPLALP
jgi:hypothetical protein